MVGKTRLAPTPSGYLHRGNLFSFALTWLMARKEGLKLLLRIDDLDRARFRLAYLEDIFRSLEALGMEYDEGPQGVDDFEKNWSQKHRRDLYDAHLKEMRLNDELFACDCSRKAILQKSPENIYPGTCLHKDLSFDSGPKAWRWKKAAGDVLIRGWHQANRQEKLAPEMYYPILKSKAAYPAYQLSSVIDDLHFNISHIVRGEDLWDSSAVQMTLAESQQWDHFTSIRFHHHPLKLIAGQKLSKSQNAPSALIYKQAKNLQPLIDDLSDYLHLPKGAQNLKELLALYRLD